MLLEAHRLAVPCCPLLSKHRPILGPSRLRLRHSRPVPACAATLLRDDKRGSDAEQTAVKTPDVRDQPADPRQTRQGAENPSRPRWRRRRLVDEGPLGTRHAELVALGVGKNGRGLGAGPPDVHPPGTKRKDALDLGLLLAGSGLSSRWRPFLVVLASVTGMKQMPTGAVASAPMTISCSCSDRIRQPSTCAQNRARDVDIRLRVRS